MPIKQSQDEIRDGTRNLLDKIGTAGDGFSVMFGAGASKCIDLPTMGELADMLEKKLPTCQDQNITKLLEEVLAVLKSESPDGTTIEQVLEMLYHIQFLVEERETKISISLGDIGNIDTTILTGGINFIKDIIWEACYKIDVGKLQNHKEFLECFMGESGRLRKLDVFTTNWDFAIEMTCDGLKFKCVDGFVGVFDGFEKFAVFAESPSEQLRTVYLHKLHGSLNWILNQEKTELRKKMNWSEIDSSDHKLFMIYPIPSKAKEILGYPYAELISRFSDAILKRKNPLLLVIGYSFTDSHISTKIASMLDNNERSNLFIVDPKMELGKVSEKLGFDTEKDERVILLQTGFVEFNKILKELQE